jgi:hypothetical protein
MWSSSVAVVAYSYAGDTCKWRTEDLNSDFMAQVNINGTGVTASQEILKTWRVHDADHGGCILPQSPDANPTGITESRII